MTNYIIEENIDFYSELYNEIHILNEKNENDNICLITSKPLIDKFFTMNCGHKFNYIPLYFDLKNQKEKFNNMENFSLKLKTNELRCPYCRQKHNGVLPYYIDLNLKKINGVNYIDTNLKYYNENKKICNFIQCLNVGYNINHKLENLNYCDNKNYCLKHAKYIIKKHNKEDKEDIKIQQKQLKEEAKKQAKQLKKEENQVKKQEKQQEKQQEKREEKQQEKQQEKQKQLKEESLKN